MSSFSCFWCCFVFIVVVYFICFASMWTKTYSLHFVKKLLPYYILFVCLLFCFIWRKERSFFLLFGFLLSTYLERDPGLIPIRWLPREALFEDLYNEHTMVYSFGFVVNELFTRGCQPFTQMSLSTDDILLQVPKSLTWDLNGNLWPLNKTVFGFNVTSTAKGHTRTFEIIIMIIIIIILSKASQI